VLRLLAAVAAVLVGLMLMCIDHGADEPNGGVRQDPPFNQSDLIDEHAVSVAGQ